jgi:hypothetical protein
MLRHLYDQTSACSRAPLQQATQQRPDVWPDTCDVCCNQLCSVLLSQGCQRRTRRLQGLLQPAEPLQQVAQQQAAAEASHGPSSDR